MDIEPAEMKNLSRVPLKTSVFGGFSEIAT